MLYHTESFLDILRKTAPSVYPEGAPECGYYIGPGWFPIVWDLSRRIDNLADRLGPIVVCDQVKEKFGTLRWYWHFLSPQDDEFTAQISEMVKEAELASAVTCMSCGQGGERRQLGHWLVTTCESCAKALR